MKHFKIKKIVKKIFKKFKLKNNHAEISAQYLIKAELVGAPSHGLSRLKMYCDRLKKKIINPNPKIKIKKISQSIAHIDADNGIGFVAADIGIKTAIKNKAINPRVPKRIMLNPETKIIVTQVAINNKVCPKSG